MDLSSVIPEKYLPLDQFFRGYICKYDRLFLQKLSNISRTLDIDKLGDISVFTIIDSMVYTVGFLAVGLDLR